MGASREKDAADYDLERFVEMFDHALTSDDPRVKNALRQLMMMVILTDTDDHEGQRRASHGPLRQMQMDMREQFRWIRRLEEDIEKLKADLRQTHGLNRNHHNSWPKDLKYPPIESQDYYQAIPPGLSMAEQVARKINSGLNTKVKKTNIGEE